jgi:hypothetical protein
MNQVKHAIANDCKDLSNTNGTLGDQLLLSARLSAEKDESCTVHIIGLEDRKLGSLIEVNALVDFITCCPENLSKAASPDNIKVGFSAAGMIDQESQSVPDFEALIGTCRRKLTMDEYDNCVAKFPFLYDYMGQHGHIPDHIFESCGLPVDVDMDGVEIRREAGISCEP